MCQKQKRNYSREFKLEAIRLYESTGKSMSAVERELGITPYLLSKWVRKYRQEEGQAFPGHGKQTPEQAEIRRLEREIVQLRLERDILKKAVAIFSQPGK